MMAVKAFFARNRILLIALLASCVWHCIWLTVVGIASAPISRSAVRFSKVAFLGPILGRGTITASAGRVGNSFLEERYSARLGARPVAQRGSVSAAEAFRRERGDVARATRQTGMATLIHEAVTGVKVEPSAADPIE